MKHLKIVMSALLLMAIFAGIGYAVPPPPPPPVPQNIGLDDISIDLLQTTSTDQSACRECHRTSGTNITGGINITAVGGVPTRHHSLLPRGVINPVTNAPFVCQDCHPSTPGIGNGILLERSCVGCHNGTSFTTSGARVGNITRPHHVNTSYASSNIGNPAANRTCNYCHGSYVANYNDGHYKPSYATDFMITPYATFKVTNFTQPDGLGGNKVWGGCLSCHVNTSGPPVIGSNYYNHHKEINGFARYGGTTAFQNASTPFNLAGAPGGRSCFVCHVVGATGSPLRFNRTNDFTGEFLLNTMELRNSTIEAVGINEPGTTNITFNGTGCQKCHDVRSLHNIDNPPYVPNGPQGDGHIQNDLDCYGCHNSWLPATDLVPGAIIPSVDSVNPSEIAAETATTVTITGGNFQSGGPNGMDYTSEVSIDGGAPIAPSSISDTQIVTNMPALTAGTHTLQIVKGGDTLSKLSILTVVPVVTLSSATLDGETLTISGAGLGSQPTSNAEQYVIVGSAGYSASITTWSDTQIVATLSGAVASGDIATVITANGGQAATTIVVSAPTPTPTPSPTATPTPSPTATPTPPGITSAKLVSGVLTIDGTGVFEAKPSRNAQNYVTTVQSGKTYTSSSITKWDTVKIVAKVNTKTWKVGQIVTVKTVSGKTYSATIT